MIRGPISRGGAQIGLGEVDRRIRLSVADRPGVLEVGLRQLVRIRTLRERRADGVAVGDQGRLVTGDTGAGQVLDVVGLGVGDRPGSGRADERDGSGGSSRRQQTFDHCHVPCHRSYCCGRSYYLVT